MFIALSQTPAVNSLYTPEWTAQQALTTSLTAESLMFAAFTAAYGIASVRKAGGTPLFIAKGWFGWCIVAVIALMAYSAVRAWAELFDRPASLTFDLVVATYAIPLASISQPIFAGIINWQAK